MRNLPITDLGSVLRLAGCGKQKDMCWGYDGFVLAHKDVNPDFDEGKPFIVVIDHDGTWQMHFENFGTMPKNEKILDDMYRAVAASCEKGAELELGGGATPGGLSGFSKLRDYGFRKEPLPDDTPVYWGGELDPARLEKWLNSGRHDDDFLVRTDGDVEPGVEGGVFVSPREYGGKITAGNTKPRPFKMVKTGGKKTISESDRQIYYWAHMLDEAFGLNEESPAEADRLARIQKAKERLAANALNGEAEEKARIICGMPDLVDICRGKYKKFIVYRERVIVVARLNGNTSVPFYCSTGLAGKSESSAKAGRWFVFWGIGRDGWFNKMGLANDFDPDGGLRMHNQFGSKVLKAVADRLDAEVGDVAGIFAGMPENTVTLEQARAAVNGCFKRDPIPWSDRHEPNSVIDYLNNMAGIFSGINDAAAVDRLIFCGSMIGAEYFKGASSEIGFRLPQTRREKDNRLPR